MEGTCLLAMRCPVQSRRESDPGFRAELENLVGSVKGKGVTGRNFFREFSHENFVYFVEFLPAFGPVRCVVTAG